MTERYSSGRFDSLLGDSSVRLFGRLMWDIVLKEDANERREAYGGVYNQNSPVPTRFGANDFLIDQLKRPNARLARIYAFSYQNDMFELSKPAIFLVHGEGNLVEHERDPSGSGLYLKKSPGFPEKTGVAGQRGSFAPEIYMWIYDRADFTIRLDTEAGTFERVLLDMELGGPIDTGSMHGAKTDPPPPPRRRRRRWRGDED